MTPFLVPFFNLKVVKEQNLSFHRYHVKKERAEVGQLPGPAPFIAINSQDV